MSMEFGEFVKVVAVLLVVAMGAYTLVRLANGPLAQALARRLQGQGGESHPEIEEMREQVAALQDQLVEMHERVEFTERLLSRLGERESLPKGS